MARDFTPPPIATKDNVGVVEPSYSFQLMAQFDPRNLSDTPRGQQIYRAITGGSLEGPMLQGAVYPDSGGDYGVVRGDGVEDIHQRFMVRDSKGEWIYIEQKGYRRPDGYIRLQAFFDADAGGPYAWMNDAAMIATGEEQADNRVTYTYYQIL